MSFDATRPTSLYSFLTMVGSGNSFDVSSVVPNLTTVASFTWPSGDTYPGLQWQGWQEPQYVPDSYYQMGIRFAISGLNDDYAILEYSINSAQSWTTFVASYGNTAAVTITRSLARTNTPTFFQLRMNCEKLTGADTAYVQVWDVWAVGSTSAGMQYKRYPADNVGPTDALVFKHDEVRPFGDNLGVTDDPQRVLDAFRLPGDNLGVTDAVTREKLTKRLAVSDVGVADVSVSSLSSAAQSWEAYPADDEGLTDYALRGQGHIRYIRGKGTGY